MDAKRPNKEKDLNLLLWLHTELNNELSDLLAQEKEYLTQSRLSKEVILRLHNVIAEKTKLLSATAAEISELRKLED